jgi:hypothetical protein
MGRFFRRQEKNLRILFWHAIDGNLGLVTLTTERDSFIVLAIGLAACRKRWNMRSIYIESSVEALEKCVDNGVFDKFVLPASD